MSKQNYFYQILGYAGIIPFVVGTYFAWCGPMQDMLLATELFAVYSMVVLSFIAGSWWGYSLTQDTAEQIRLSLISCAYALFAAACWLVGYLPLTILLLGIGYVVIWLHEFFVPVSDGNNSYRTMRTLLTLTVFVCHLLVAMQLYSV